MESHIFLRLAAKWLLLHLGFAQDLSPLLARYFIDWGGFPLKYLNVRI